MKQEEEQLLLRYAAALLEEKCCHVSIPEELSRNLNELPLCKEMRGLFVSLHKGGDLRGCIGYIEPVTTVIEALHQNTLNAAFRDPRFAPLTAKELDDLEIEISLLSLPVEASSYKQFVIGKDGIILKKGGAQAVFLPQVAPEQGWGEEETLMHLCMKAGLPADGWKEGCRFFLFQAKHFKATFKELKRDK